MNTQKPSSNHTAQACIGTRLNSLRFFLTVVGHLSRIYQGLYNSNAHMRALTLAPCHILVPHSGTAEYIYHTYSLVDIPRQLHFLEHRAHSTFKFSSLAEQKSTRNMHIKDIFLATAFLLLIPFAQQP